jgi:hypothetical protein
MHEDDGDCVLPLGEQRYKVQLDVLNLHREIVKRVDVILLGTPVICVQPVVFCI